MDWVQSPDVEGQLGSRVRPRERAFEGGLTPVGGRRNHLSGHGTLAAAYG